MIAPVPRCSLNALVHVTIHCPHIQDTLSEKCFTIFMELSLNYFSCSPKQIQMSSVLQVTNLFIQHNTRSSSKAFYFGIIFHPVFFCCSMAYGIGSFVYWFIPSFIYPLCAKYSTSSVPDTAHALGMWLWTEFQLSWSLMSCPVAFLGDFPS